MIILTKDNKLKKAVSLENSVSFIGDNTCFCESCGKTFRIFNNYFLHECFPIALDCYEQKNNKERLI